MKPADIYQKLCSAADLDAAIFALAPAELTAVAEHISRLPRGGGIPAQIFGAVSARLGQGKRKPSPRP